jgi:signal transduction protein with GAF and PtsI domain
MTRIASESALSELAARVAAALGAQAAPQYDVALRSIAEAFGAVSATLHRADAGAQQLHMVAQLGLPEQLIALTRQIPFGKGIAGLCAVQREPITLCNLQTDTSGAARPNAKQTGVAGAISVPVFGPDGALVGTLGVGKLEEHTYSPDEVAILGRCANHLGQALAASV